MRRKQDRSQYKYFYDVFDPDEEQAKDHPTGDTLDESRPGDDTIGMRTLHVRWSSYATATSEESLEKAFSKYGPVEHIYMKTHKSLAPFSSSALVLCSSVDMAVTIINDTRGAWRQQYTVSIQQKDAPSNDKPHRQHNNNGKSFFNAGKSSFVSMMKEKTLDEYERLTFERLCHS